LLPSGTPQSSESSEVSEMDLHPYDYAEAPLPLYKKMLLWISLPLVLVLAVIRLVMVLLLAVMLVLLCTIFGRCRWIIQPAVSIIGRSFLLCFGVWPGLLRVTKPTKPEPSPMIVLAPHVGALEAFVMMYDGMPRAIAMETYANLPVVSSIFRASGGLSVPVPASNDQIKKGRGPSDAKVMPAPLDEKSSAPSAEKPSTLAVRHAIAAHKKSFDPTDPAKSIPLCILPEGTTHSGRSLIKFFSGAFEGGGSVQPVLLSYPYHHFHAAFFGSGMGDHVLRLLINPYQRVEVTYLPVYHPSAEENENAELYAENVRLAMAATAGLTPSAYGAKELRKEYVEKRTKTKAKAGE